MTGHQPTGAGVTNTGVRAAPLLGHSAAPAGTSAAPLGVSVPLSAGKRLYNVVVTTTRR
jgi:hypothetical protein